MKRKLTSIFNTVNILSKSLKLSSALVTSSQFEDSLDTLLLIVPSMIVPFAAFPHEGKWFESNYANWIHRLDPKDIQIPNQRIIRFIRTNAKNQKIGSIFWDTNDLTPITNASAKEMKDLIAMRDMGSSLLLNNVHISLNASRIKELEIESFMQLIENKMIIIKLLHSQDQKY